MPRFTCSTSGSVYRSDYEVYREGKEAFLAEDDTGCSETSRYEPDREDVCRQTG